MQSNNGDLDMTQADVPSESQGLRQHVCVYEDHWVTGVDIGSKAALRRHASKAYLNKLCMQEK